jgi:hypothetical protein
MLHSENKPESLTKFYWSFYELNNNKTYSLQYIEYLKKNKLVDSDFELSYTEQNLNNGNIINYKFGQDFFQWFDNSPSINDVITNIYPSKKEENFIIDFYKSNIIQNKDEESEIINFSI